MSKRGRPHEDGYHQQPLPDEILKRFLPKPERKKSPRNSKTYAHLYTQVIPPPPPEVEGQLSTLSTPPTSAIAQREGTRYEVPSSMYPPDDKGSQDDSTGD